jgi:hypothetical protein
VRLAERKMEYLSICSRGIAPGVDLAALDAAKDLRDKTDTDSGDVSPFVKGFHKELVIGIPDMNVS